MKKKSIVLSSKFVRTDNKVNADNTTSTIPLYFHTCVDGTTFFSNEDLKGQAVSLTERKAGEKYTKADGTEGTVTKNGWNFDGAIGTAVGIREMANTANALKELQAVKFD